MKRNSLGRDIPAGYRPYGEENPVAALRKIAMKPTSIAPVFLTSLSDVFSALELHDGMTFSFHHHLRDGDFVTNLVMAEADRRGLKNLTIAPSSLFPCHKPLVPLIERGVITGILTNYMNGPVADAVTAGKLHQSAIMDTHGGRARAIESGDLSIDVAFLAVPRVDAFGNGTGRFGKSACGVLGYADPDLHYAKKVVLVTDEIVVRLANSDLDGRFVDYVVAIPSIGDRAGIVSGTTRITKEPVGLKIARDAAALIDAVGLLKEGFSMQTGAGGTSLAVVADIRKIMVERGIHARFASGGITAQYVEMLEAGLIGSLKDVQDFDLDAVASLSRNPQHEAITAAQYGSPDYTPAPVVDGLDFVVLGATEIDLDFNVNVTTDSEGKIIGGSGGHADTAHGAKVSVVVTNLVKARLPIVMEHVTTITTPGSDVDVLVTERGIAVHPRRTDLLEHLRGSGLNVLTIQELMRLAHTITGEPVRPRPTGRIVALVRYRDGSILDVVRAK